MTPYRSPARSALTNVDPFVNPPPHPRVVVWPATLRPPAKRPDYTLPIVWGCVVAFVIVFIDALVRG